MRALDELPLEWAMGLAAALEKTIKAARSDLSGEASGRWPPGARVPIVIGGEHIGWASIPRSGGKVTITDADKFLAWVTEKHPAQIEDDVTVPVTDELLAFLEERGGERFIKTQPKVNEGFIEALVRQAKDYGGLKTPGGEIESEIPGVDIEKRGGPGSPKVDLEDLDTVYAVLSRARDAGLFDVAELLALPSPNVLEPADMDPDVAGRIWDLLTVLKHDGCGGWTWNRLTNEVRCKCGAKMIPPAPPKPVAELADGPAAA